MSSRDTLLAFYSPEFGEPSASEPLPPGAAQRASHAPPTTPVSNTSATKNQPSPAKSGEYRQPSQYQPGSRARSVQVNKPIQQQQDVHSSTVPSALKPAGKEPSSPGANPFGDHNSATLTDTGRRTNKSSAPHPTVAQDSSPSMDEYRSPPNSGRPMLSVDPHFTPRHIQEPPRAAFAAPHSPAISSQDTLCGSGPPSPGYKEGLGASGSSLASPSPRSPASREKNDTDRFAPADGSNGVDFWKRYVLQVPVRSQADHLPFYDRRFSMVVRDNDTEKAQKSSTEYAASVRLAAHTELYPFSWLSRENRKRRGYKRWLWLVAFLIIVVIAAVVVYTQVFQDDDKGSSAPSEHDFGLGSTDTSAKQLGERLARRTTSPRVPHGFQGHARAVHATPRPTY